MLVGSLMMRPLVGGCIDGDWWLVIEDGDFCLVLVILIALHHLMMAEVDGFVSVATGRETVNDSIRKKKRGF